MPKINREEYEILKELDDKWKWIARDRDRLLFVFNTKPRKGINYDVWDILGWDEDDYEEVKDNTLFQFIQWEDENPYNIAELIEEYEADESHKKTMADNLRPYLPNLFKESEETEVNFKENLKQEVEKIMTVTEYDGGWTVKKSVDVDKLFDLIDQLDELETLSLDWIDDNKKDSGVHYIGYYVPIGRLHDLLVPKQEEADRAYKDSYEKGKNTR